MANNKLDAEEVQALGLEGRAFLHEQGQAVCRGYVAAFNLDKTHWALDVRDVEYLDKLTGQWRQDAATDTYGGALAMHCSFEVDEVEGIVSLHGYGMVVHIAPEAEHPWQDIDWPELDGYEGGPMEGRLTKRGKKKRRKQRQG